MATIGVGIQQVDLNAVAHKNTYAVQANVGSYKAGSQETCERGGAQEHLRGAGERGNKGVTSCFVAHEGLC